MSSSYVAVEKNHTVKTRDYGEWGHTFGMKKKSLGNSEWGHSWREKQKTIKEKRSGEWGHLLREKKKTITNKRL